MTSRRTKQAEQELCEPKVPAKKNKPMRRKKVAVKKARESASMKSSGKPRIKKR